MSFLLPRCGLARSCLGVLPIYALCSLKLGDSTIILTSGGFAQTHNPGPAFNGRAPVRRKRHMQRALHVA
jgi:hypothetical protein